MDEEIYKLELLSDCLAGRIFAALPDDPDCHEAFQKWRNLQKQIFKSTPRTSFDMYRQEQSKFNDMMKMIQLNGVEKF